MFGNLYKTKHPPAGNTGAHCAAVQLWRGGGKISFKGGKKLSEIWPQDVKSYLFPTMKNSRAKGETHGRRALKLLRKATQIESWRPSTGELSSKARNEATDKDDIVENTGRRPCSKKTWHNQREQTFHSECGLEKKSETSNQHLLDPDKCCYLWQ